MSRLKIKIVVELDGRDIVIDHSIVTLLLDLKRRDNRQRATDGTGSGDMVVAVKFLRAHYDLTLHEAKQIWDSLSFETIDDALRALT